MKRTIQLIVITVWFIYLTGCAMHQAERPAADKTIVVTGSRIKAADTRDTTAAEPQTPTSQALSRIANILADERHNNQQLASRLSTLTETEKETLYQAIANERKMAGQIFKRYRVNPTIQTSHNPVSTFAMDADNGSYKLAATMLKQQYLPDPDGIRIEEFVNSMNYQYQQNDELFALSAEVMPSPFRSGYHVLHVGIQGKTISDANRNPSQLVLVADVSGSMAQDGKLELLKQAMKTLVSQLGQDDSLALVKYSDLAQVVLEPTRASNKIAIYRAIDNLSTEGSTYAEAGLTLGYQLAEQMFQPGFNNRVILTSDGMANVGATTPEVMLSKVSSSKDKGIFLTTLGVGQGMYNDYLLEQLANQGNGNYLYVANQKDIQTTFIDQLNSQLQTIAKDAKVQLTFNPNTVSNYRLLGYENRHLEQQDFTDAHIDGGELGAGHRVTALYEVKLKPQVPGSYEHLAKLALAYKKPQGHQVHFINKDIPASVIKPSLQQAAPDSRLSVAVAAFAEKLRQSYWARSYQYADIERLLSHLPPAYQQQAQVRELTQLISQASHLDTRKDPFAEHIPVTKMRFDRVPLLD